VDTHVTAIVPVLPSLYLAVTLKSCVPPTARVAEFGWMVMEERVTVGAVGSSAVGAQETKRMEKIPAATVRTCAFDSGFIFYRSNRWFEGYLEQGSCQGLGFEGLIF
jgi:hypothetical protein